jgi:predicted nucleic acid-binding protein
MSTLEPLTKCFNENKTLSVSVYKPENKNLWDGFVSCAKNGVFLFFRDYMGYHSDRFQDHSLLFFKDGQLVGLLPANLDHHALHSHAGLTFGGVISGYDMTQFLMLEIFEKIVEHCKKEGITQVIYKAIPYIYHSVPADEDLYALFRNNAKLIARNVSSTIFMLEKRPFDGRRKESLRKAKKNNLFVKRSYDLKSFMDLAEYVLMEKHGVRPVHTIEELAPLMSRFPDNIKLFVSCKQDVMLAGIVMYESANVAHGQYAANSAIGRSIGAQDIIEDYLINEYYKDKKYFDFGISTLKLGKELNEGLLTRKEGFGASAVTYDFYELIL